MVNKQLNKQPIHIFLDDVRRAPHGVIQTNTVEDTIELLKAFAANNIQITSLSLDHDLGYTDNDGREMTGYDVIFWIEQSVFDDKYIPPKKIFCHSQNPVDQKRIRDVIMVIEKYMETDETSGYFRDRIS